MTRIFLIALVCASLFSCKKSNEEKPAPEEKKYDITFSVSDFSQITTGMSKNNSAISAVGDTLSNYADYLYYRVYNSAGVLVNTLSQYKTTTGFGRITDRLPAGNYNIFFAAGKSPNLGVTNTAAQNYTESYIYDSTNWDDTFTKLVPLTVASSDINQTVRLDRLVGGLELVILDSIPANIAKISIVYQNETYSMYIKDYSFSQWNIPKTKNFTLTSADIGQRNRKFLMHISNTSTPSTVFIRAYDSANGLIVDKTVNNVSCYRNRKTVLSGNLFNSGTNPAIVLNVFVSPDWGLPNNISF